MIGWSKVYYSSIHSHYVREEVLDSVDKKILIMATTYSMLGMHMWMDGGGLG